MSAVPTTVVIVVAAWIAFSGVSVLARRAFIVENLEAYGVPERWWPWLGVAKTVGAAGLLAGLVVPAVGVAAAMGLGVYFVGALLTVTRARAYSHLPFPLLYLVPAVAAGWLLANAA